MVEVFGFSVSVSLHFYDENARDRDELLVSCEGNGFRKGVRLMLAVIALHLRVFSSNSRGYELRIWKSDTVSR